MQTRTTVWALLFCLIGCSYFGLGLIQSSGPTYDEPVHLAAGYTDLTHGRYRLNAMDHPPLAEMWAALPLLFKSVDRFAAHPAWVEALLYHYGDLFLYHNRLAPDILLNSARAWNLISLTLLLGCVLVFWSWRLDGIVSMWGSIVALSFCVPWFSNAALVTTDAASAALFFAACAMFSLVPRTRMTLVLGGAAVGAALGAKFNMILLPPIVVFIGAIEARLDKRATFKVRDVALSAVVALFVLAAIYRLSYAGLYIQGLTQTLTRLSAGRSAYLMGQHSNVGWWWYFPTAMVIKTPLPILILAILGAVVMFRSRRLSALWVLLPPILYFCAALTSKTQIGYRHLLPLYPFFCLWSGVGVSWLWQRAWAGRLAVAIAGMWLAVSVSSQHPFHLAYFNEIARLRSGPWLSDSNIDWGQDLPELSRLLAARGNPPVILAYFGSGDPAAYGIRYIPIAVVSNVERQDQVNLTPSDPVFFAISQTNLVGTYYRDHALFDWLKTRKPLAIAGGSIFIYDLTHDVEARERLAVLFFGQGRRDIGEVLRAKRT